MNSAGRLWILAMAATFSAEQASATSDDSASDCSSQFFNDGFNSSGRVSFYPTSASGEDERWYFALTLRDYRHEHLVFGDWVTMQSLEMFYSVPGDLVGSERGNNTKLCAYRLPGQNVTLADDPSSCENILGKQCSDAISKTPLLAADAKSCPSLDIDDVCGKSVTSVILSTCKSWQRVRPGTALPASFVTDTNHREATPANLSSKPQCSNGFPGSSPQGYQTYGTLGADVLPPDSSRDSFDVYDLRVRQPVPVVLAMYLPGEGSQIATICITPNTVKRGSRSPTTQYPPSAGSATVLNRVSALMSLIACIVVIMPF
ncbi:hypothetical protein QQS21_005364 [Conoideocrella luteorostrata]|uniref:Uncharacterized protein n=1 Tax=Conoideocrella luteorostrata TaxID=1105319 RepID=A0AAJ0CSM3_9HYPO|nr:hypothetical protein QQS21_005364 [Conoideocrella luteorostrata]